MLTCPNCTNPLKEGAEHCPLCGIDLVGVNLDETLQGITDFSKPGLEQMPTVEGPALSEMETAVNLNANIESQLAVSDTLVVAALDGSVHESNEQKASILNRDDSRIKPPAGASTQILLERGRATRTSSARWLGLVALIVVAIGLFSIRAQLSEMVGLSSATDLSGTWFRIGDKAEGTAVSVSAVGEGFEARATLVAEHLRNFGFTENDLLWREIELLEGNHYRGKVLYKQTELPSGKVIRTFYREHDFFLEPPNLLRTRSLASGDEVIGTEQVWKKLED